MSRSWQVLYWRFNGLFILLLSLLPALKSWSASPVSTCPCPRFLLLCPLHLSCLLNVCMLCRCPLLLLQNEGTNKVTLNLELTNYKMFAWCPISNPSDCNGCWCNQNVQPGLCLLYLINSVELVCLLMWRVGVISFGFGMHGFGLKTVKPSFLEIIEININQFIIRGLKGAVRYIILSGDDVLLCRM